MTKSSKGRNEYMEYKVKEYPDAGNTVEKIKKSFDSPVTPANPAQDSQTIAVFLLIRHHNLPFNISARLVSILLW